MFLTTEATVLVLARLAMTIMIIQSSRGIWAVQRQAGGAQLHGEMVGLR